MKLKEYYTPNNLASFLIRQLTITSPKSIIDICAGTWNLLYAAAEKWPEAKLTGVDIEGVNSKSIIEDGRVYADYAKSNNQLYDLVLANPPFRYEKIDENIISLIDSFHDGKFNRKIYNRLECTMLISNMKIVNDNGTLAAIVPISIINSESNLELRKYIAREFYVEKIIILPSKAFSKEIQTAIIILKRAKLNKNTLLYKAFQVDGNYEIEKIDKLSNLQVKEGIWYEKVFLRSEDSDYYNDFDIYRGKVSSNMFINDIDGIPIVHSTSINKNKVLNIKYIKEVPKSPIYIKKDDILIVRVGRKCGEYVIIEDNVNYLISDCVLLIRPRCKKAMKRIINRLTTDYNEKFTKGITTKYITKSDLKNLFAEKN